MMTKIIESQSTNSIACHGPLVGRPLYDNCQLSVVIPVYRSQESLRELYQRLVGTLTGMGASFEILFVEDCGGDNSWSVIQELAAADERVRGIKLSKNFGQHAATICGFSYSQGEWVATLDDDLEQAPESLPDLYNLALDGYDLVYGVYTTRSHKIWRNITSSLAKWVFSRAIPSLNDSYTREGLHNPRKCES